MNGKKHSTLYLVIPAKMGDRQNSYVDAFFPDTNLIVEYREKQHTKPVEIMDRRMTVSGVHRGEQRRIYDVRKEKWAADNKIRFVVVTYADLAHKNSGRLKRDADYDLAVLRPLIEDFLRDKEAVEF